MNEFEQLWLSTRFQKQLARYQRERPHRIGPVYRVMKNLMLNIAAVDRERIKGNPSVVTYRSRVSEGDRMIDAPLPEGLETVLLNIGPHDMNDWAEGYQGDLLREIQRATQVSRDAFAQKQEDEADRSEEQPQPLAESPWRQLQGIPGTYGYYLTEEDLRRHGVQDDLIPTVLATKDCVPLTEAGLSESVADPLESIYIGRLPAVAVPQPPPSLDGPQPIQVDSVQLPAFFKLPMTKFLARVSSEQERLIRRPPDSFTIVKGAAGTGKTVVGVRWIEQLVKNPSLLDADKPILFVCYNQVLKDAVKQILTSVLGGDPAHFNVQVETIYTILGRILWERRLNRYDVRPKHAHMRRLAVVREGLDAPTERTRKLTDDFLWDEITEVIYGRAIESEEEYVDPKRTERTGRSIGLNQTERRYVWSIYELFHQYSMANGTISYEALAALAAQELTNNPEEERRYRAVVIDEAQDLLPCMFRVLYGLQARSTSGMMILGDAVQNVYRASFRWADTGFRVVGGHVTILRECFRTTLPIIQAAKPLIAGQEQTLGDDLINPEAVEFEGPTPEVVLAASRQDEIDEVATRIWEAMDDGIQPSSIAVFANSREYL